ncbi:prolipoprotein diacylglyceryl transferase [Flavobacterium difficile]|uniref:Phosphatidylglycerol--prolipoprotein diacylglyceryl transferase n=1 Tax=Flavobacterium difficile TaxID=2709659 RepID=A0ABX0I4M8_9FLAO|nr:prolipoprotein diacylglyceryl transferase [Flavobacterium difficile]NHM01040.1 prolipoprotein diacylglyceryl transferase [Flavobacterium difficile]
MIWNPTEGIDLGFFMIRFYSLTWVAAFALGWYITKFIFEREKESIEKLDNLFVYTIVATMVGARLGHVIFYQSELFTQDPLSVLLPVSTQGGLHFTGFSGLASHGAAIAIIITMYYIKTKVLQRPLLWILDRIVIPVASGAVFIRLGNFMNSEIFGKVTSKDSFMAMKFIKGEANNTPYGIDAIFQKTQIKDPTQAYNAVANDPQFKEYLAEFPYRYPAQLFEAILYIPVFFLLFYMYWRTNARNKPGLIFGTFLVLLWSVRFFVEFVKDSQGGFEEYKMFNALSTGQWLSIPFIIIGFYFIYASQKKTVSNNS